MKRRNEVVGEKKALVRVTMEALEEKQPVKVGEYSIVLTTGQKPDGQFDAAIWGECDGAELLRALMGLTYYAAQICNTSAVAFAQLVLQGLESTSIDVDEHKKTAKKG